MSILTGVKGELTNIFGRFSHKHHPNIRVRGKNGVCKDPYWRSYMNEKDKQMYDIGTSAKALGVSMFVTGEVLTGVPVYGAGTFLQSLARTSTERGKGLNKWQVQVIKNVGKQLVLPL